VFAGWAQGDADGTVLGEDNVIYIQPIFAPATKTCDDGTVVGYYDACPVPIDPDPNPDVPQDVTPPTE
ncbi:MAG: hypothetical protein IIZ47_02350, partial [Erysipelotrichaceae bacterium]|nr:hypothetical protein [Erysipelotrichaceae bacterium]